jgi:hypothetical protein
VQPARKALCCAEPVVSLEVVRVADRRRSLNDVVRGSAVALLAAVCLVCVASPARAATTVALWNMGDSGTTMSDASGRGHVGSLHGVAVRQAGISGAAFGFAQRPAYVTVPASADLTPGTGAFRVTLYARMPAVPSASVEDFDLIRMGLSTTSGGDWKVEVLRSGQALCEFRGASGVVSVAAGPSVADNRWHAVSCSRGASAVSLTVDGQTWSRAGNPGAITSAATVYLGAKDGTGADQYTGLLDSVSVSRG